MLLCRICQIDSKIYMGEQDKNRQFLRSIGLQISIRIFFKLFIGIRQVAEGCILYNPICVRFKVNTMHTFLELHTYKGKE